MSAKDKITVNPLVTANVVEVLGVNDKTQLGGAGDGVPETGHARSE